MLDLPFLHTWAVWHEKLGKALRPRKVICHLQDRHLDGWEFLVFKMHSLPHLLDSWMNIENPIHSPRIHGISFVRKLWMVWEQRYCYNLQRPRKVCDLQLLESWITNIVQGFSAGKQACARFLIHSQTGLGWLLLGMFHFLAREVAVETQQPGKCQHLIQPRDVMRHLVCLVLFEEI